jgi:hypothetical protein
MANEVRAIKEEEGSSTASIEAAARELGVSEGGVYRLILDGKLWARAVNVITSSLSLYIVKRLEEDEADADG